MSQTQMNINDYVNLNLDKNDMSTPLNNLPANYYQEHPNTTGTQMMDNLIQQMEQMPQSQPLMLSGQQMQMPMQQPPQQMPMQMAMQPQMQPQMQQQIQTTFIPNQHQTQVQPQTFVPTKKPNSEKEKAIKELEISSSDEKTLEKKPVKSEDSIKKTSKSLTSNINDTVIAVILYTVISNPFITPFILKYVPFFESSPNLLFGLKIILFAVIYHLVRWFM
jgi:hypothetical protein